MKVQVVVVAGTFVFVKYKKKKFLVSTQRRYSEKYIERSLQPTGTQLQPVIIKYSVLS